MPAFCLKYKLSHIISWEYYENSFHLLLSDFTHVEKYRTAPYTQADRLTPSPYATHADTYPPWPDPRSAKDAYIAILWA